MEYNGSVPYPIIRLQQGKDYLAASRHPWIFSQGTQRASAVKNGETVDVYSSDGKKFVARGYYNGNSQIAIRILTRNPEEIIDQAFFERRFRELFEIRKRFIDQRQTNAYRLVFGESDGMPGLIVDRYNNAFVMQIHTLGMEMLRDFTIAALKNIFHPDTIFEKSDVSVRKLEGLPDMPIRHIWGKPLPREIEFLEHGVKFLVNIAEGQKTGFFLDQRENRKALQQYVRGSRVLNAFCYTAGFSLYAALAGATETVNVDLSQGALDTAQRNFELNRLPLKHHQFIKKDVFDFLGDCEKRNEKFDIAILDPPAFVKNKKMLEQGLKGYLFINERALGLLPRGGILVSSSCSAHVTDEMFQKTLSFAAQRAKCTLKTLEIRHQPIDHPYNLDFPEGKYLKFYVMVKS